MKTCTHFRRFDHGHQTAADDVYRFADVIRVEIAERRPSLDAPRVYVVVAHVAYGTSVLRVDVSREFDGGEEEIDYVFVGFVAAWQGVDDGAAFRAVWS